MIETGKEDSSPRWDQQSPGQDVEPPTELLPVAIAPQLAPSAPAPWLPGTPRRDPVWRRITLLTFAQGAVAAVVLVLVSMAALAVLRGPYVPGKVKVGPSITVVTGASTASTVAASPTARPSLVPAVQGVIKFGSGGDTSTTQQCNGVQQLGTLNVFLDNSKSNVAVEWWVSVGQAAPDGKESWAAVSQPYGTLMAGQSQSLGITPISTLCTQLAGRGEPVMYTATVLYGGVGGIAITDTITPPVGVFPTPSGTPSP